MARTPDELAAELSHWVNGSSRLLGKNLTALLREAAEALRELAAHRDRLQHFIDQQEP